MLALVWQLMRAYTLALLDKITGHGHPIVENGIIEWANNKVKNESNLDLDINRQKLFVIFFVSSLKIRANTLL